MVLQRDDRVRVVGEQLGEWAGCTGTVKATLDEYLYERYGDGLQATMLKKYYHDIDAVVILDYDDRHILIQEACVRRLEDDEEVQELEALFNDSRISGDQESTE